MSKRTGRSLFLATWWTSEQSLRVSQYFRATCSFSGTQVNNYSSKSNKDVSNGHLPAPGAPLRRASVHEIGMMSFQRRPSRKKQDTGGAFGEFDVSKQPPWKEPASVTRLTKALEKYKVDLWQGRNSPPGSHPTGDALPFLEDTITHLVGRERNMLLSCSTVTVPPSQVRAAAMKEALSASNGVRLQNEYVGILDNPKNAFPMQSNHVGSSLIYQANRIISIIAVIERLFPLTNEQRLSIGKAVAQVSDRVVTPSSAWKALQALLHICHITEHDLPEIISKHPGLMSNQISIQSVVDCLHLLELDQSSLSDIICAYPEIFFLDIDKDILPTLAYLSDLGLDELEMADVIKSHPSVFKPGNTSKLQSGVAFWTGKGLSRKSIVNLIKYDPSILETNKLVMQMKVDWLTEYTGLEIDDIALEPRFLSSNLGSLIAPRIVYANHIGKNLRNTFDDQFNKDFCQIIADPNLEKYLNYLGSSKNAYEGYIDEWYTQEFMPWLERKSRASEILLQEESEVSDLSFGGSEQVTLGNFAASKELAWEQQMEREREWHMAWHAWKREQQTLAVAERTVKRQEKRIQLEKNDIVFGSKDSQPEAFMGQDELSYSMTDQSALVGDMALNVGENGNKLSQISSANVHDLWRQRTSRSNCRSVFFLSRKWTCDSNIDEALEQAIMDSRDLIEKKNDFDVDLLESLSTERVQSCAVSLLLLLRASDFGVLEPSVFNAWAARSGVDSAELIAAKALISSSRAAFVRSEPSWKYHSVPPKVWLLRDTSFYAPNLLPLRDTRGSRNVADLADLIYRSLKENPGEALTRLEISDMYDNRPEFLSKRMRFAIGVLLEQGMVIQRRRKGIASGPMELVLTEPILHAVLNKSKLDNYS